ncbi:hypothetical protein DSECCO2_319710 [anaerobic digester metagenome]
MDEQTIDLRMQRTYKLLSEALYELTLKQPFEEISVTDICKKAMVHRTTFYKHFQDKYQLLETMFSEEQRKFSEIHIIDGETEQEYYGRVLRQMFEYVKNNKVFFVQSVSHIKNDFMTVLLQDTVRTYLTRCFRMDETRLGIPSAIPIPIMSEYYTGAAIALVMWWLQNGMEISIEQMVEYISLMIVW